MQIVPVLRCFASLVLLLFAAWLPAQSFDLDRGREPVVSLDGLWRFHPGDSPPDPATGRPLWAEPGFDDSGWPLLKSGESWSAQGYRGMSGYGWYRFTVRIPAGHKPTSLLLAPIVTAYRVYVDGKLVGGSGQMPPILIPSTQFSYHLYPLALRGDRSARAVLVALRVWHAPLWAGYVGGGPFLAGHLAGDPALLATEQQHRQLARNVRFVDSYSYSITAPLVGIAILALFFIRPAAREYLWFALMLLAQAADNALYVGQQIYSWPPVPIYDLADATLAALNIFSALCFFSRVLKARPRLLSSICLALVIFSPLPAVLYWPGWLSAPASAATQLACLLPAVTWILNLLITRAVRGDLDARLLLLPTLLDFGYYLADNLAILLNQVGWTRIPHVFEIPLPLPPFSVHLGILLNLFFLLALLVYLIRRFALTERHEMQLAGELEAARKVQEVFLPDQTDQCPGISVEYVYQPAERLGGDFFQQICDGQDGILLVVGDVSGKGLTAALLVSVLVGAIRTEAAHGLGPAELLSSLNDRMMGRSHGGFTTCMVAHITASGLLTLSSAGHLPPYLNGEEIAVSGSLPLGILQHARYEAIHLTLRPGDRLTFVSDGVVEAHARSKPGSSATSSSGELFGFDRTRSLSRQSAACIAETARAFGQLDDITVVTVEFSGKSAAPAAAEA
ncbi:MAG: SpoIIE family protein phosphatase [Terracidiphilus sp.]